MGLFQKKALYKYKPLERVRLDIDKVNKQFAEANPEIRSGDPKEYCEFIGETDSYCIYAYQRKASGLGGYFLRQEKASPKKVAYLGTARKHCCVFHGKLFTIDSFSPIGNTKHPLICKDINTGVQTVMNILSDQGFYEFIGPSMHFHCQDTIHSLSLRDDTMTLEVYRYPADSVLTGDTFHEECIYYIHIKYADGEFRVIEG